MKDVRNSAKNAVFLYLHFRYHGDSSSRSRAYRHKPQLTIALEGRRDFSPEKRESFLAYTPRAIASARPRARVHPTHVDIGLSRQAQTQVTTFDSFKKPSFYVVNGNMRLSPRLRCSTKKFRIR